MLVGADVEDISHCSSRAVRSPLTTDLTTGHGLSPGVMRPGGIINNGLGKWNSRGDGPSPNASRGEPPRKSRF
jgi:hypothetical protein